MDRNHLAETVSRRDADAEPPRMGSRRVSARCFRFMSVVNNGFSYIHWHRDMNCVSPPKARRRPIHGGSNPASMQGTAFGSDTQSISLIFVEQQWLNGCFISFCASLKSTDKKSTRELSCSFTSNPAKQRQSGAK